MNRNLPHARTRIMTLLYLYFLCLCSSLTRGFAFPASRPSWLRISGSSGQVTRTSGVRSFMLKHAYSMVEDTLKHQKFFEERFDSIPFFRPNPTSIMPTDSYKPTYNVSVDKNYELLAYKGIDLKTPVMNAAKKVNELLNERVSEGDRRRGPLVLVRGIGGGKTRALVELGDELSSTGVVPLAITFNHRWSPSEDFRLYHRVFPESDDMVYALTVAARITSMCTGLRLSDVARLLVSERAALLQFARGSDFLSQLIVYVANRIPKAHHIVLLVDETLRGHEEMSKLFPPGNGATDHADFTATVRSGLMDFNFGEIVPGMRAALVLSSLDIGVSGFTQSGRNIHRFVLSETLNSTECVNSLFLTHFNDSTGSARRVELLPPAGKNVTADDCQHVLSLIADMVNGLPRALEFVNRALKRRMNNGVLAVNQSVVSDVVSESFKAFLEVYPRWASMGLPDPDLMYALLFGEKRRLDERVADGISRSLFVNSLDISSVDDLVELRSSIVPLYAAIPADTKSGSRSVAGQLKAVMGTMQRTLQMPLNNDTSDGNLLAHLSINWMKLMLTTAAKAQQAATGTSAPPPAARTSLFKLLRLSEPDPSAVTLMDSLMDDIDLPTGRLQGVGQYQMKAQLNATETSSGGCDFIDELERIELSDVEPCKVLLSAKHDCWDYALAYRVGNTSSRGGGDDRWLYRIAFFGATEVHLQQGALPGDECDRALRLQQELNRTASARGRSSGLGAAAVHGDYIYVYHTLREGASQLEGKVLTLGREDAKRYFNFIFDFYVTTRAVLDGRWLRDLRP